MDDTPQRDPASFPRQQRSLILKGPVGDLEAVADVPETPTGAVAIVCHSLSGDGGNLHNKVVHMIERSLREIGAHTVRFNFRGVGLSQGEFDQGVGEAEDLIAVSAWARSVMPDHDLWLAGFGFGCYVTARAAPAVKPSQLVSVAPAVTEFDFQPLERYPCPWLVVQGDLDQWVSPDAVYKWAESLDEPRQLIRVEDADHHFHRHLMNLRGVIKNGVKRQLPTPSE